MSAPDGLRSRDLRLDRAVRTAGLLYGRVFDIRLCAPNGIRTRVAALKGRNPRPLDDGGPGPTCGPRPRPGGSGGKYSDWDVPTRAGSCPALRIVGGRSRPASRQARMRHVPAVAAPVAVSGLSTMPNGSKSHHSPAAPGRRAALGGGHRSGRPRRYDRRALLLWRPVGTPMTLVIRRGSEGEGHQDDRAVRALWQTGPKRSPGRMSTPS